MAANTTVARARKLHDEYAAAPVGAKREPHYLLWSFIAEVVPEVPEGNWRYEFPDALRAVLVNYK